MEAKRTLAVIFSVFIVGTAVVRCATADRKAPLVRKLIAGDIATKNEESILVLPGAAASLGLGFLKGIIVGNNPSSSTTTSTTTTGLTSTSTTTTSTTTTSTTVQGACGGDIIVHFGNPGYTAATLGTRVPFPKAVLAMVNTDLLSICTNPLLPQCTFAYIFPGGVVNGVSGQHASRAVMMYYSSVNTWALIRAPIGTLPVGYSATKDLHLAAPNLSTNLPWATGAASVFVNGQSVQSVSCAP